MNHVDGMNDLRLRPRLLRSLARDHLPDEKRPFPDPAKLSSVLSSVKDHGLLSEALPSSPDRKLADEWSSAFDAWVERLLLLISSNTPDKCWAGICLLGVTCEECSSQRFLASYSLWFQKLLSNIQPPSSTDFVRVASCASLVDLFTRLAHFPNLKKDGTSLAAKLIQPALQLLNESGSGPESVWEGAVNLLCTLMSFFPASMHRHHDNAEAVFVSKIMSGNCNSNMSKKIACCLALLPKMRGDEGSWFLMMQKILIALDMLLSDAFRGIEKDAKSSEIIRLLVPQGKQPPPPLGGQSMSGESSEQTTKRLYELLVPRVSALMHCCCIMLTNPYPVQVTIPIRALLALVWRVLIVDGSLHESLLPFTTSMQQELLCFELPVLHLDSLELLVAIINGIKSQLLPHAADVVRHLTQYFRRSSMPSIRIKLYSILQSLLISMGVGMALYLTQEVISNAFADLNDSTSSCLMSSSTFSSKLTNEAMVQSNHRKRKHASESTRELSNGVRLEVCPDSGKPATPVSVKIAALRALEAVLTVGGSLQSDSLGIPQGGSLQSKSWRSDVDLLLINVATNACDVGWANEGKNAIFGEESAPTRAEFQLAALQALLASLLSPVHIRPPYLSQALELFRQGKQETGTRLATFCALALLALEVLIHPRSLPLDDFPVARGSMFDEGFSRSVPVANFSVGNKLEMNSFSNGGLGTIDDLDDEFVTGWLRNDQVNAEDASDQKIEKPNTEQPELDLLEESLGEKHMGHTAAPDNVVAEENQLPCSRDVKMQCNMDEDMAEMNEVTNSVGGGTALSASMDSASPNERAMEPAGVSVTETAPSEGNTVSRNASNIDKDEDGASKSLAASKTWKDVKPSYNSDTDSLSSLPDIVDEDPDSDE